PDHLVHWRPFPVHSEHQPNTFERPSTPLHTVHAKKTIHRSSTCTPFHVPACRFNDSTIQRFNPPAPSSFHRQNPKQSKAVAHAFFTFFSYTSSPTPIHA